MNIMLRECTSNRSISWVSISNESWRVFTSKLSYSLQGKKKWVPFFPQNIKECWTELKLSSLVRLFEFYQVVLLIRNTLYIFFSLHFNRSVQNDISENIYITPQFAQYTTRVSTDLHCGKNNNWFFTPPHQPEENTISPRRCCRSLSQQSSVAHKITHTPERRGHQPSSRHFLWHTGGSETRLLPIESYLKKKTKKNCRTIFVENY